MVVIEFLAKSNADHRNSRHHFISRAVHVLRLTDTPPTTTITVTTTATTDLHRSIIILVASSLVTSMATVNRHTFQLSSSSSSSSSDASCRCCFFTQLVYRHHPSLSFLFKLKMHSFANKSSFDSIKWFTFPSFATFLNRFCHPLCRYRLNSLLNHSLFYPTYSLISVFSFWLGYWPTLLINTTLPLSLCESLESSFFVRLFNKIGQE